MSLIPVCLFLTLILGVAIGFVIGQLYQHPQDGGSEDKEPPSEPDDAFEQLRKSCDDFWDDVNPTEYVKQIRS